MSETNGHKSDKFLSDGDLKIESIVKSKARVKRPKCIPPTRYVFVFMGFLGLNVIYSLRFNLSVAIVSMVSSHSNGGSKDAASNDVCASDTYKTIENFSNHTLVQEKVGEFDWDDSTQGIILGSFFWGYVMTQLPGGKLAQVFGSKRVLLCSMLLTSILTILSPFAARIHYVAFIIIRGLEGFCQGVSFPSMHAMLAKWLPKYERSFMSSFVYSGSQIGTVITLPLAAILSDSALGWPSVFYVFGSLGIIWAFFWALLIYETPQEHPNISQQELRYILQGQFNEQSNNKNKQTPWRHIFCSVPLWAVVVAHFGQNWGFYTLLTQLPNYFKNILHFDLKSNGLISAIPYLLQAIVGWSGGYFADKMIRSKRLRLTTVRKLLNTIGFLGPAICLFCVTIVKCDALLSVIFFALAMGINGLTVPGFSVNHLDLSPNFAGTLMGITNCIANFAGILAPYTVGVILSDKSVPVLNQWRLVFYISCLVYICASLVYLIFGSAELQYWNNEESLNDYNASQPLNKFHNGNGKNNGKHDINVEIDQIKQK